MPQAVPYAGVAQLVEHYLAKVDVAGSNPVSRSTTQDPDTSSGSYPFNPTEAPKSPRTSGPASVGPPGSPCHGAAQYPHPHMNATSGNPTGDVLLLVTLLLAGSVWLGGYVAIAVVMLAARRALEPAARVAFFRALGRAYLPVGAAALLLMIVFGAALMRELPTSPLSVAIYLVAGGIAAVLAIAVAQARRMTRLRQAHVTDPANEQLAASAANAARYATFLRALLGVLSVALVVLGALLSRS